MSTIGSLSLCRSLLEAGLVDRFRVVMFPVITGATGQERIYDGYPDVALEMIDSRTFDGRIQLVEYVPTVLSNGPPPTGDLGRLRPSPHDRRRCASRPGHLGRVRTVHRPHHAPALTGSHPGLDRQPREAPGAAGASSGEGDDDLAGGAAVGQPVRLGGVVQREACR